MTTQTNNTLQTFWVLIGSLSAFGFSIVSSMILSRYFDKEDYGTYRQVMYVYNSLLVIFTLGLPRAYSFFLPRVPTNQVKDLISKINFILISSGLLMACSIYFGSDAISGFLKNEDLVIPLRYFSLVPLFMLPTMGLEGILSTFKKTKILAVYNISTRILMLLCVAFPVIIFDGDVADAIIGFSVASFLSFIFALYLKFYPVRNEEREKTSLKYKQLLDYTIPIMFAGIWGVLIKSADQFFISRYFGTEIFADFANGSLELPFVSMIIAASSIVLAPIFSKKIFDGGKASNDDIINLWKSVLSKTIKLIYPLVAFFFCFADIVMILLYGEIYETSGIYFQIKLVVNFFTVIAYGPLLLSIGGNKYYYKVHMYGALILILLEWISIYTFNSPVAITIISVACQIGRIIAMLLFISRFFRLKLYTLIPFKLIFEILLPSLLIAYGAKYLLQNYFELNVISTLIFSGIIYFVLFAVWAYIRKIDYYSIIKPVLVRLKK